MITKEEELMEWQKTQAKEWEIVDNYLFNNPSEFERYFERQGIFDFYHWGNDVLRDFKESFLKRVF